MTTAGLPARSGASAPAGERAIDDVLLDFGGVLVQWDPRAPLLKAYAPEIVERFLREVEFGAFNDAQDAGRTWVEGRAAVAAAHPQWLDMLDRYWEHFPESLTRVIPGTAEIVEELDAARIGLFGLTNWSAETFAYASQAAPAIARMKGTVVSGREGVIKPDPRIFEIAIGRFGLDPRRTLFVDDKPANVEGARAVGLQARRFTGAERLRADLAELGALPVSSPMRCTSKR